MKSVFDETTREELVARIDKLNDQSVAQWGKMNVFQMLRHCVLCEEMYLNSKKYKRPFIGRIFGKLGLKRFLKDESPLQKNAPTNQAFRIREIKGDVTAEKHKWASLIEDYAHYPNNEFEHWFFGKMTKEQVGQFVYKHTDHHLRQFNC